MGSFGFPATGKVWGFVVVLLWKVLDSLQLVKFGVFIVVLLWGVLDFLRLVKFGFVLLSSCGEFSIPSDW